MAGTGQGAGDDSTAGTTATPEPRTRRRRTAKARGTEHVTQQRVAYVFALLVGGYGYTRVIQKVAAAHAKEAAQRLARQKDARGEALSETEREAAAKLLLWGEEEKPPAERTVARYMNKAKDQLEQRGRSAAHLGDRLFGLVLARLDETYQMARRTRNPSAMARSVEAMTELFAFEGALRPALSALAATGARTGETEPPPEASMTEEAAADAAAYLVQVGRQRRDAALAAQSAIVH